MMFLGIDTSAYTTSAAIVDKNKNLLWEERKVLKVIHGERGLAQSEAFFQHIQNLPDLMSMVPADFWAGIAGIGVSAAPRPVQGSYMPVFTAGVSTAKIAAGCLQKELVLTTHQEGHLSAGIESAGMDEKEFLAVHLSGGTTELLKVNRFNAWQMEIEILGGTTDLHAGQFVDRVGVSLGLGFPAGKELEKLAAQASKQAASLLPASVSGYKVSFSGVESAAQRMIGKDVPFADVARAVEGCIARTVTRIIDKAVTETGIRKILMVGGVCCNQYLRTEIPQRLKDKAELFWAELSWSSDNAIGVAFLTRNKCRKIREDKDEGA
ncbi:peptidase M22 glycoprotease [Syntrophobotulus glycolicus DSM 8271]|uniref:N(6)-L-threonylcarbamoyladenine synthase n=1 Tax=Syntrophobotulus glycolicus (strain DSM 8271 / FlGlyR) TaxID=645991 RepID=F0T0R1_SYNGF|nr:peptidase [Syntrophobotulus glycolicus]ADY56200.1 peptidase M22 glycoprotease [Syntrophobotulus glycolicus DSM 8271]